jgi:hypothetical protein
MLDVIGFHTDRDYQAELDTLNREIRALTIKVTEGRFYSYEDRHNTYGRLDNLHRQAGVLTREAAMETQRLDRLEAAVRLLGDAALGFVAYVVFGPAALPLEPLYEVRLIDPDGYTVPDMIRTNLPAARVDKARTQLLTVDGPAHERMWGRKWAAGYRVQVTSF